MQRTVQDNVPKTQNPSSHDTTQPDNATPVMQHNRRQLLLFSKHSIYPSETTQHVLRACWQTSRRHFRTESSQFQHPARTDSTGSASSLYLHSPRSCRGEVPCASLAERPSTRSYRIYSIKRPGRLFNFWTFRVSAYSRWALIKFSPFLFHLIYTFLRAYDDNEVSVKVTGSRTLENGLVVPGTFKMRTPNRAIAKFQREILLLKELFAHMDISVKTLSKIPTVS